MSKAEFTRTQIENMCERLITYHSANPSQIALSRLQLDTTNIKKYTSHLSTDEGIDRISHMTKSLIRSDEGSLAVITEYLQCFREIMAQ